MASALRSSVATRHYGSDFDQMLVSVHSRIEKCFLEGGSALVSVMEIVNKLVEILDHLTGVLDGKTTLETVGGLKKTITDLAQLPGQAAGRQVSFNRINELSDSTAAHVDEMREIIRYLGTFAITVKITGAGLAEFSGFADEIRERIQSGAAEIDRFAKQLGMMRHQLDTARNFSQGILADFEETIPAIVSRLEHSSAELSKQHKTMSNIADQVKYVAQAIQNKVGSALSALQIGDATRQRIEHIRTSFDIMENYVQTQASLSQDENHALRQAILSLAHSQLQETLDDFRGKCETIFKTITSFSSDAAQILTLKDELNNSGGNADSSLLHTMEQDIKHACALSKRVQNRSQESDSVVKSVTQSAQSLLEGIETIRAIKTDIHYMALNSNLRCSRLGDAGRSVNVVSGELRSFAAYLEKPADAIVEDLRRVEDATLSLTADDSGDIDHVDEPLHTALQSIHTVAEMMDEGLENLNAEGQQVFQRINAAVTKLDFKDELANQLTQCLNAIGRNIAPNEDWRAAQSHIEAVSASIFPIYTMAQERQIHQRILQTANVLGSQASAQQMDDDDMVNAALF